MQHTIQHGVGAEKAKKVIDHAFNEYKKEYQQYKPMLKWVSPTKANISLTAMGQKIAGSFRLDNDEIVIELVVGGLLKMFEKPALAAIDKEVKVWLAKVKRGEI